MSCPFLCVSLPPPLPPPLRPSPSQMAGMASIRGVNVPMYTALRRTTVAFTMAAERLLAGQRHSAPVVTR